MKWLNLPRPMARGGNMTSAVCAHTTIVRIVAATALALSALLNIPTMASAASPPPAAATAAPAPLTDDDTSLDGDTKRTRFVIGLEKTTEFQIFALSNPSRVIIELPDIKVQLPQPPGSAPIGLVSAFRAGLSAPGRMRIVIDVTGPVVIEKSAIEKGRDGTKTARLMVEIAQPGAGSEKSAARRPLARGMSGLGGAGLQPPSPRRAVNPADRADDRFRQIIVIDPGHGGHDSGATKYGTVEKEVVLAFSLKLRDKLEATGRYRVLLTRKDDTFVELDERRAFADRAHAALFIAVHADYAGSNASGATIYSLRDNTAREMMRSAKKEVQANILSKDELGGLQRTAEKEAGAVKSILADLAVREVESSQQLTKEFTDTVVSTMGASTNMMNNPDREANFRVLKSVKMPSVLIELAFVTNRRDAANLKSDAWRERVASSIQRAVDSYFSSHVARLVR